MKVGEMIDAVLHETGTVTRQSAGAAISRISQAGEMFAQIIEEPRGTMFGTRLKGTDDQGNGHASAQGEEDCASGIFADNAVQVRATVRGLIFEFVHSQFWLVSFGAKEFVCLHQAEEEQHRTGHGERHARECAHNRADREEVDEKAGPGG